MRFSSHRFSQILPAVSCLGASGVLFSSLAFAAPIAAAKAAPGVAKDDPQVHAAFDKMRAAYGALESYSMTMSTQTVAGPKPSSSEARFFFRKPNQFALLINGARGQQSAISDGTTFYVYSAGAKKYSTHPMPSASLGRVGLMQYPAVGFLTPILAGVDPFTAPWGGAPKSFNFGPAGTLDGIPVERIVVKLPGAGNPNLTYLIGKKDHLLRRVRLAASAGKENLSMTETYSAVKINSSIPLSTFTFTPPHGAKLNEAGQEVYWNENLKIGSTPPAFEATDLEGKIVKLEDLKGKVVLLDFWATWCGPCRQELPHVKAAYEKYRDQGFEIIGVSFDQKKEDLDKFIAANNMTWPQIFDGKGFQTAVNEKYGAKGIPFSLVIGRDGEIAAINPRMLLLESAVEKALSRKAPAETP